MITRREWVKNLMAALLGSGIGATPLSPLFARNASPSSQFKNNNRYLPHIPEGLQPNFVNSGPGFARRIALTFDDGPFPGVTEIILNALQKRNIKATFFMIGRRVLSAPSLGREVVSAGHEIGNHTQNHVPLSRYNPQRVYYEIAQCQDAIENLLSFSPRWFRPPYGAFRRNQGTIPLSRQLGIALWNVDPQDWRRPGVNKIVSFVTNHTRPGSIILLHDIHQQTAQAIDQLLDNLIEREFTFTTLTGFLGFPYPIIPRAIPVSRPLEA
jgi:peptidoglycan/xylan/chitin deacetylase (PgdA/CDA1 family)